MEELRHDGAIRLSCKQKFAPFFAEFLGTFLLMTNYLCNLSNLQKTVWSEISDGLQYAAIVYTIGQICGGHCNPSITFSMLLASRFRVRIAAGFVLAQVLGAVAAAPMQLVVTDRPIHLGPRPGVHWWQAMVTEITYTTMMVFVYMNCAASPRSNPKKDPNGYTGISIGMAYLAGQRAGNRISGAVLNPAIAFALQFIPLITKGDFKSNGGMAYLPYEIMASFLAVGLYKLVRQGEESGEEAANLTLNREAHWLAETPLSAKVVAEFLGTFFVIVTRGLVSNTPFDNGTGPFAVGSALAAMIYSVRGISGAHFNPAVSFAVWLSGRKLLTGLSLLPYIFTQLLAGIAGGLVFNALSEDARINLKQDKDSWLSIGLEEAAFTFLLSYVQLATSTVHPISSISRQNNVAGLAVGGSILTAGLAVTKTSGAIMNPALALVVSGSNALADGAKTFYYAGIYCSFELIGGAVAALAFRITHVHVYTDAKPVFYAAVPEDRENG